MDLTPQEKSRAWWKGTLMGAAKGLAVGLAVGAASALLLELVLPSFPVIYNVFKSFLMMSPAAGAPPVFSVVPLAIFSGVSGLIGGLFSGGSNNVSIGNMPAARDGDRSTDNGTVTGASPTTSSRSPTRGRLATPSKSQVSGSSGSSACSIHRARV